MNIIEKLIKSAAIVLMPAGFTSDPVIAPCVLASSLGSITTAIIDSCINQQTTSDKSLQYIMIAFEAISINCYANMDENINFSQNAKDYLANLFSTDFKDPDARLSKFLTVISIGTSVALKYIWDQPADSAFEIFTESIACYASEMI